MFYVRSTVQFGGDVRPELFDVPYHALQNIIGHGANTTVWAATNLLLQTKVAVKILDPDARQRYEGRFLSEAQLGRRLQCDRLLQVFDVGRTINGQPFLTMPKALRSLATQIELRTPISMRSFLSMCNDLLVAVDYLHLNKFVHLDINPSNIVFLDDPQPRWCLSDLGLAQQLSEPAARGSGTLGFSAPERITSSQVTTAADIYSLGKTLETALPLVPKNCQQDLHLVSIVEQLTAPISTRAETVQQVRDLFHSVDLELASRPSPKVGLFT